MYHTVDATKEDQGPIKDYQVQMSLYYVCFVVVFSFFFLNMFVALIIVTFQEQGEKEMDGCELDRNQVFKYNTSPIVEFLLSREDASSSLSGL